MCQLRFLRSVVLLIVMAAFSPTHANADFAESANALRQLEQGVHTVTLRNGLRVFFYQRGVAPVFSGVVAVRVGGSDEPAGLTGASHIFEHMAFKGTSTLGTRDYAREAPLLARLEELASSVDGMLEQLSGEQQAEWQKIQNELKEVWVDESVSREFDKRGQVGLNATTDKELTRYFVSLPRSAFEFWCAIESARLLDPTMRQFYQEREVVLEERRMRYEDDPGGRLYEKLLATAYTIHPYRNPIIGYEADLRRLTAKRVAEFRSPYYVAANMVVALVGDVDPQRDMAIVERYFGDIPSGVRPARPQEAEPRQQGERQIELVLNAAPELMLAYHKPNYPHRDDAAISLLSEILAGSRVSPLYEELVKKRRVATTISSEEGPGFAYPNLLYFHAAPRAPHTNKDVLEAFDEVIAMVTRDGVSEEQLAIAKRSIAMDHLMRMSSNMSLALDLASSELLYDDWKVILSWYAEVMRVTPEDIVRVLKQYLDKSNRTVGRIEFSEARP